MIFTPSSSTKCHPFSDRPIDLIISPSERGISINGLCANPLKISDRFFYFQARVCTLEFSTTPSSRLVTIKDAPVFRKIPFSHHQLGVQLPREYRILERVLYWNCTGTKSTGTNIILERGALPGANHLPVHLTGSTEPEYLPSRPWSQRTSIHE